MTRGEKSNLLRLVYRLETLSELVGSDATGACKNAAAEREQVRRQIESALGFTVAARTGAHG